MVALPVPQGPVLVKSTRTGPADPPCNHELVSHDEKFAFKGRSIWFAILHEAYRPDTNRNMIRVILFWVG
jgi:hypothetical protein